MPLWALALLLLAAPARAEKSSATVALESLLELEQSIPRGGIEGQLAWQPVYIKKADAAVAPLKDLFIAHGMKAGDPVPADWLSSWGRGYTWSEALAWTNKVQALDDAARCELVKLAYAFAVWRVTTEAASIPILKYEDILVRGDTPLGPLWSDRARAAWQFRFIKHIHPYYAPIACKTYKNDADARWSFINSDDRKPLGFAVGMCGRPMNSHWLDEAVEAKELPAPRGWTKPVD